MTQFMLAGPLIFLYEVGVLVSKVGVKMAGRPLSRKEAEQPPTPPTSPTP